LGFNLVVWFGCLYMGSLNVEGKFQSLVDVRFRKIKLCLYKTIKS
jgi:hypothetical protein